MKTMLQAALLSLALFVCDFANATLIYAGTNNTNNSWARPVVNGPGISTLGPVKFHAQEFFTDTSGFFNFTSTQDYDGYLHLYEYTFDASNQLANLLIGNDDSAGSLFISNFSYNLVAMRQYILITSAFSAGDVGTFTNTINIDQGTAKVFAGKVGAVSEPSSLAILALAILGFSIRRFQHRS